MCRQAEVPQLRYVLAFKCHAILEHAGQMDPQQGAGQLQQTLQ